MKPTPDSFLYRRLVPDRGEGIAGRDSKARVQFRRTTLGQRGARYYAQRGMTLSFTKGTLESIGLDLDWVFNLQSYEDPLGQQFSYSCRGPRPLRVRALAVNYDVSSLTLGSPLERVLEVFGQPDPNLLPGMEQPGVSRTVFTYWRKGIIFAGERGIVVKIVVRIPW